MSSLLIMACSGKKHPSPETMAALHRYQGPMWSTLRAALDEVHPGHQPQVWFLSAKYGFHPANIEIADYELKLTEHRARDLLKNPCSEWREFGEAAMTVDRVMFAGGALYRNTMRRAIDQLGYPEVDWPTIVETDGGGIGYQRAQLRAWITGKADTESGDGEQLALF